MNKVIILILTTVLLINCGDLNKKNAQGVKSNKEVVENVNRQKDMTPLIKEFSYDAPIEEVWRALTETEKMKVWYFPQIQEFEPTVGFKFRFNDKGSEYQKEWVVTRVTEGKTLAHNWAYKNYPGTSEVTFDLFQEEDQTKIRVTQTGLESFPNHPHFKRERFEWGWDNLLGQNLKHLLENSNNF